MENQGSISLRYCRRLERSFTYRVKDRATPVGVAFIAVQEDFILLEGGGRAVAAAFEVSRLHPVGAFGSDPLPRALAWGL